MILSKSILREKILIILRNCGASIFSRKSASNVTDEEKDKLWEGRAEWLSRSHSAGSFTISFDLDQPAVLVRTGDALLLIPVSEVSRLSGLLVMMANQLLVVGII
jgi:hypothetical protein